MNHDTLNPNHPVAKLLDTEWHKLCAVLIEKLNHGQPVCITEQDIERFNANHDHGCGIVADSQPDGLHLRIVEFDEAQRLAREEGGLPA